MSSTTVQRIVTNGSATNDLVWSAYVASNDQVFPAILGLYVRPGSIAADVTYGKGVFWKRVTEGTYDLRATDIKDGTDCRDLPYDDAEVDCVVLDPPYMHSPGGTAHLSQPAFEDHYRNNGARSDSKYHEAVLDLYRDAGEESVLTLYDQHSAFTEYAVGYTIRQVHARKNHSYFIVFWKPPAEGKRIWQPPAI